MKVINMLVSFVKSLLRLLFGDDKKPEKAPFRYSRRKYLISQSENELYQILKQSFGSEYEIFPQMHLNHLFGHEIKGQSWKGALSHIQRKSVDFIICSRGSLSPLCAIELDGSSHDSDARITRDTEVERIFEETGLPLLRYRRDGAVETRAFIAQVADALKNPQNLV